MNFFNLKKHEKIDKGKTIDEFNGNYIKNNYPSTSMCYPNCDVNVWLRSCLEEVIKPIDGVVTGNIPKWICGSLLRNGPGNLKFGESEYKHLFDSSGLLHRFAINNGKVTYQCRFIESEIYKRNKAANRIVVSEFGTAAVPDPCQSIFSKVSLLFKPGENISDNTMISIYPFGDEYFTFTESPVIHRINPRTLETEERKNLYKTIGIVNHTAHPHIVEDGTVYNLGMTISKTGPCYTIVCFPKGEKIFENAHIVATIPARWKLHPGYMHSFGITKNYFIIVEQPLAVSVPTMLKNQLTNQPLCTALQWFPEKQTCIYIIDRKSGKLKQKFYTESFFYLHIINQYEKDEHIIIDICCYKDPAMLNCMYIESMREMQNNPDYCNMFRGRPKRFILPLNFNNTKSNSNFDEDSENLFENFKLENSENLVSLNGTKATAYLIKNNIYCEPEILVDIGCETPRINYEKFLGKEYRYFYAISSDVDADNPGTIIKVDVKNKTKKLWCEKNVYPSEPIFIPSPMQTSEDDGVILAALIWGNNEENRVGLLVLCAKTWIELGRCEFKTTSPVPKCLHGWFIPKI